VELVLQSEPGIRKTLVAFQVSRRTFPAVEIGQQELARELRKESEVAVQVRVSEIVLARVVESLPGGVPGAGRVFLRVPEVQGPLARLRHPRAAGAERRRRDGDDREEEKSSFG
jgi:hypothetical protein